MDKKRNDTLIIIPAFNEAWNIVSLIFDLAEKIKDCDILVVNDASVDNTGQLAEKTGMVSVLNFPYNLGIGAAVQAGFKYANKYKYEFALQFDGDGQHIAEQIPRLMKLLRLKKCDVVIGSRFCKNQKSYKSTFFRRIGIRFFTFVTLILIRKRIYDCTSGFRAYNRRAIKFLSKHYPADYPEPEALILLGKNKFKISEVFTPMRNRKGGESSISKKSMFYMIKVFLSMIMTATRPKVEMYEMIKK
jgi:glycosyltransferase involved in cell wall biosynthesis